MLKERADSTDISQKKHNVSLTFALSKKLNVLYRINASFHQYVMKVTNRIIFLKNK